MTFTKRADGIYSAGWRFDVIRSEDRGDWVAFDWERGKSRRFAERFRAEAWCELQPTTGRDNRE